jgi:endonuclease-8
MEFAGERWLNVHLGLIGKFTVDRISGYASVPPPRGAVRLRMVNDDYLADLRGAVICAVVTPDEVRAVLDRLGPDPLEGEQDPARAFARVARSGRTIAELLMDQSVVAGVGNVYRCEVLYRHRVNPFRPGREIRRSTWNAIWADLVRLMPLGVAFNQIVTMEDQVEQAEALAAAGRIPELTSTWTDTWAESGRWAGRGPAGVVAVGPDAVVAAGSDAVSDAVTDMAEELGVVSDAIRNSDVDSEDGFAPDADEDADDAADSRTGLSRRFYVYRRHGEPCRVCGSRIRTQVLAGRNLFWCGRCQRRR